MLTKLQIGASGVLLVQYKLLKFGIESAPMTTDEGIDLVVYSSKKEAAMTVQVKSCLKPKAAGGKGKSSLDWWLPITSPAQLVATANLENDCVWLFTHMEFTEQAQQKSGEKLHLWFYTDPAYQAKNGCHIKDFEKFKIESRAENLIG